MTWPTPYLHGNGTPCPDCRPSGELTGCATCGGLGVVPLPPEQIVATTLKDRDEIEARRLWEARQIASEIRRRIAKLDWPFKVRDAFRSHGLTTRAAHGQLHVAAHQITISTPIAQPIPSAKEMKAALLTWANAAEEATPRFARSQGE